MKDQLPKAYLRIDVNVDHTHPDPGAFIRLLCAGSRQHPRGRFKSWAVLSAVVGKTAAKKHRDVWGDVVADGDAWVIDGWDIWQEGDMTVGERMRRYRDRKRNGAVTEGVTLTVTEPSTEPLADRNSLSEAVGSRQNGCFTSPPAQSEQAVEVRQSPEDVVLFGQAVVEEWHKLRGSDFPLPSQRDFHTLQKWQAAGIPLRVVLRGMADLAEVARRSRRDIRDKPLAYFDSAVQEAARMWRQAVPA